MLETVHAGVLGENERISRRSYHWDWTTHYRDQDLSAACGENGSVAVTALVR
jgi:hypothetical protein